ncbi:unnamed protein product [Nippostrongylus brasiliensis]|uniref:Uncharacterized protein n=1 Tax=Nippostrongylus brasiliensis TaxID=27835 RepID=A0A0N4Y6N4_NIPBR|nr:unnamed protein product [Nippostrongylus brasiliensis]
MKCSNDVLEKGNIIAQLHHQKLRNRVMPVAVDFDHLIGEPRRVAGLGWAVPCDVVGLDSKKAKMVRFHPSVEQLSRSDRSISSAAVRDALKVGNIGCFALFLVLSIEFELFSNWRPKRVLFFLFFQHLIQLELPFVHILTLI